VHTWPHAPQFEGSLAIEVAHDVPASAQSAYPALQDVPHVDDAHVAV
jgi:hypothetical protein